MSEIAISVVVPVFNEEKNAGPLHQELIDALKPLKRNFEIIFVDDCSTDGTQEVLKTLSPIKIIRFRRQFGQSCALDAGIKSAKGDIIITLDGDGQNDPADLPRLLAKLTRAEAPTDLGMVAGKRTKRQDNWSKRTASRIANNIRKAALKDGADDSGSGVKVFKREAFLRLPYFDHMHRFMAALMLREGYAVEFLEVNHRQRSAGRSKYTNLGRLAANMTDLFGVMWLRSRARLPGGTDEI